MKLENTKCPNCGAEVKINKDDADTVCKYCGASFNTETSKETKTVISNTINNIAVPNKKSRKRLWWSVGIAVFAVFIILSFMITA